MIKIGVYDSHPLLRKALTEMIERADEDFETVEVEIATAIAEGDIRRESINIMLISLHHDEEEPLEFLRQITQRFERVRCIMLLMQNEPHTLTSAIKKGAKGIVSPKADMSELRQAILTVRNGFEFFSKSVTALLVDKYVDGMKSGTSETVKTAPDIDSLSARQIEILKLWGNNLSNKEIADRLYLSVRTVESHKNHIMQKLNLKTTVDIIRFGIRNNIIDL